MLASNPVDEGALNAMTIAFRELQVVRLVLYLHGNIFLTGTWENLPDVRRGGGEGADQ